MATKVKLTIKGADKTRLVVPETLLITNVLTQKADEAEFTIRKFGDRNFKPSVGQEVVITTETASAGFPYTFPFTFPELPTRIFAGNILQIEENYAHLDYVEYKIKCVDYTRYLDRKLVVANYTNQSVLQIIQDIKNTYLPAEITIAKVAVETTVNYIAFNYLYPSECLKQLAELTNSDWYIDYDKDIHFFAKGAEAAPFNLSDTGGKYVYESLRIRRDNSNLKNTVIVRGSEFLGDTVTADYLGDGTQQTFVLPYRMSDLQVTVSGQIKNVGVDPIDQATLYDAMHNFQEKFVRFRTDKIPNATKAIKISGQPYLPVLVKVKDDSSVENFGTAEYYIVDKSIKSKEGGRQRAKAELTSFKATMSEGEFRTYESGLKSGMAITVQSTLRGLSEEFVINQVRTSFLGRYSDGSDKLVYSISLITKKTYDHIEMLLFLLNSDRRQITLNDDEVLDEIASAPAEQVIVSEVVATNTTAQNLQEETITPSEVVTPQALNYAVKFVLGPLSPPSGTSRVFILDGSRLA